MHFFAHEFEVLDELLAALVHVRLERVELELNVVLHQRQVLVKALHRQLTAVHSF